MRYKNELKNDYIRPILVIRQKEKALIINAFIINSNVL